jgi:tetratricopeptide (TPR) repeat protein
MPRDPDKYDLFVSYARADNGQGWVTGFVEALLEAHRKFSGGRSLTYFLDKHAIHSLDDWQQSIFNEGLAKSRLFLAFVSPSYLASEWCRREWKAWIDLEIAKHILASGAAPIYFVEVPGFLAKVPGLGVQEMWKPEDVARRVAELCRPSPIAPGALGDFVAAVAPVVHQLRDRRQVTTDFAKPFADAGLAALRREDLRRVLARLAADLDDGAQFVRGAADSENTVPPYNKRFTGRLAELLDLRARLRDDRAGVVCGVHGLGGVGKTELAFAYAHAFAGVYPGGRFLVPCEGKPSLRQAVLCLGEVPAFRARISDEERKTSEALFAAVARCLGERLEDKGHVLLVLDNVTDVRLVSRAETDALTELGPQLHLLATTRELPPQGASWLTLGELPEADAMDLLEKHRPFAGDEERAAAQKIAKRLGGFALAVELVAAWLAAHPGSSYAGLADGLGLEDLETISVDRDVTLRRHDHERRLSAVLGPVLRALSPAELRAVEYAAFLPPDQVVLPWLKPLVQADFPAALEPTRLVADPWKEICSRLVRLALFGRAETESSEQRIVRVHRLMQELVRRGLEEDARDVRQKAVDRFVEERSAVLEKTTQWQDARWEIDPVEAVAWLWADAKHERASWLLNRSGLWRNRLADWTAAESLFRSALTTAEGKLDRDEGDVAAILANLGLLLRDTSRFAEAELHLRRALEIDERLYGKDHPNVATDLDALAVVLQGRNRMAEAEPLLRRGLDIREKSLGKSHSAVGRALNNLATLLSQTNRLSEAEPLLRRAFNILEESLGEDHPDVAMVLNNLAHLLRMTGRLSEAEPHLRRALKIFKDSLGKEHPDVALVLNNLAQLLFATNRSSEAEPHLRRALKIYEESLGKEHPDVAKTLNNLATLLSATDRGVEAEPLLRKAIEIYEESLGKEHPDVAKTLNNLATLLSATDRGVEAEPLLRKAIEIYEESLGEDHPDVALALNNLATLLSATDRGVEAEPLSRRAVGIVLAFTRATGHSHPDLKLFLESYKTLLENRGASMAEVEEEFRSLGPEALALLRD